MILFQILHKWKEHPIIPVVWLVRFPLRTMKNECRIHFLGYFRFIVVRSKYDPVRLFSQPLQKLRLHNRNRSASILMFQSVGFCYPTFIHIPEDTRPWLMCRMPFSASKSSQVRPSSSDLEIPVSSRTMIARPLGYLKAQRSSCTTKIRQNTCGNHGQSVPLGSVLAFWHMPQWDKSL